VSIDGRTGRLRTWEPKHPARRIRRKGFHPVLPGELVEIDTVDIFVDGLKRYLITAIDLPTRQTDNSHEFLKHFITACQQQDLVHYFNYPRHPQSNAHLKRFNRTIQEQFAYWHTDLLDDIESFNRQLMAYLICYNTEKPHRSIGKKPPLRYYVDNFVTNPKKSNMLWTLTKT